MVRWLAVWVLLAGCVDPEQFEQATDAEAEAGAERDAGPEPTPDASTTPDGAVGDDAGDDGDAGDEGVGDGGVGDSVVDDAVVGDVGPDGAVPDAAPPPEPCDVTFDVALPEGTPEGAIHLAGTFYADDARNWNPGDPELSMRRDGSSATLTVRLPTAAMVTYKYTRGDWAQVEVAADCDESPNRDARIACVDGAFEVVDVVAAWTDTCQ